MTTTSKTLDKYISPLIASQIPGIYAEEGPMFIEFVKAYYEWLELEGNVGIEARMLQSYRDIDTSPIDRFVDSFRAKYLAGIPKDMQADQRLLMKHIKSLYASKGTEQGLKLLFRILFGESAELVYPGDSVLRLSDARFNKPVWIDVSDSPYNSLLVGEKIWAEKLQTIATIVLDDTSILKPTDETFSKDDKRKYINIGDRVEQFYSTLVNGVLIPPFGQTGRALGRVISIPSTDTIVVEVLQGTFIDRTKLLDPQNSQVVYTYNTVAAAYLASGTIQGNLLESGVTTANVEARVAFWRNQGWQGVGAYIDANGTTNRIISVVNTVSIQKNVVLESDPTKTAPLVSKVRSAIQETIRMPDPVEAVVESYERMFYDGRTINALYISGLRGRFEAGMKIRSSVISEDRSPIVRGALSEIVELGVGYDFRVGDVLSVSGQGGFGAKVVVTKVSTRDGTLQIEVLDGGSGYSAENTVIYIENVRTGQGADFKISNNGLVDITVSPSTSISRLYSQMDPEVTTPSPSAYIDSLDPANWRAIDTYYNTEINQLFTGLDVSALTLAQIMAQQVKSFDIGTITTLTAVNRGEGYTGEPRARALDEIIAGLLLRDNKPPLTEILVQFDSDICNLEGQVLDEGKFTVGDRLRCSTSLSEVEVVRYNTSNSCYVKLITRGSPATKWKVNFYTNESFVRISGVLAAQALVVYFRDFSIQGDNAKLKTEAATGVGIIDATKVIDTGYGFLPRISTVDGLIMTMIDEDRRLEMPDGYTIEGVGVVQYNGYGEGRWENQRHFLSEATFLHDSNYHQEYSYEVRSKLAFEKYASILKEFWHPSGTGLFGRAEAPVETDLDLYPAPDQYVDITIEADSLEALDNIPLVGSSIVVKYDGENIGSGIVLEA